MHVVDLSVENVRKWIKSRAKRSTKSRTHVVELAVENVRHVNSAQKGAGGDGRATDGSDGRKPVDGREQRVVDAIFRDTRSADDKGNTVASFVQRRLAPSKGSLFARTERRVEQRAD